MKRMKFAHVEGHTDLTYTDDGQSIITCGADGDFRVWKGYEDDDPECVRVGDEATCVAFKNGKIYVGTDMQVLQIYSHPDHQTDGIVTRFTANINHVTFNKDGSKVAAGSGDMTIKVCDIKGKSRDLVLEGHKAPILSLSLDPKSEFLASSSCDGTVRLWSLSTGKEVKSWTWGPKTNDFGNSPSLCRVHFEPSGRYLAIPDYFNSTVKVLDRGTWKEAMELTDPRIKDVSICSWSPCGKYLAASSKAGDVLVFELRTKSVVFAFQHEKKAQICNLMWNPVGGSKEIAFCDSRGYLGLLENVTGGGLEKASAAQESAQQASGKATPDPDDIMDLDDVEISISQIKRATGFIEEDGRDVFTGVRSSHNLDTDSLLDDVLSKTGSRATSPLMGGTTSRKLNYPSSKRQEPFQPGSSPAHLLHRYMVWNSVGIVRCFGDESAGASGESSIEVEFHDTSVHHGLHIPNTLGHTLAALSTQALVLACPAQDDSTPSKVVCVNFASSDGHREWSTSLPAGEEALALAVGESWLAVATSRRILRIFSIAGLQRAVLSLPGQIVCMSGHSNKLLLAFHLAMGMPGEQALGYGLLSIDRRSPVGYEWLANPQSLPLGPDCDLSWAGFTDEGTPGTLDSSGLMQLQVKPGLWYPLVDTRQNVKGKSDHYFIIGVSELERVVRCVLCKGARYPPTVPRPNMALLDARLPLCDTGNEKSQLEESLILSSLQSAQLTARTAGTRRSLTSDESEAAEKAERAIKESLMKMFALACQAERDSRAVEVAEWMNSEQMLQLAVKYATRARKRLLADRLTDMAETLLKEREEAEAEAAEAEELTRSSFMFASQTSERSYRHHHDDDRDVDATPPILEVEDNPILQAKQRRSSVVSVDGGPSKTIRPLSQGKKNPFKKTATGGSNGSDGSSASPTPRGLAIFDQPAKPSPASLAAGQRQASKENKPKGTKQPTLFSSLSKKAPANNSGSEKDPNGKTTPTPPADDSATESAPPTSGKSGFQLWLEQNRAQLESDHPEVANEGELVRLAAQKFKSLPEEERQKYNRKRKSSGTGGDEQPGNGTGSNKKTRPTLAEKLSAFEA